MGVTYIIPTEPFEIKRRAFGKANSYEWAMIRRDKDIKLWGLQKIVWS